MTRRSFLDLENGCGCIPTVVEEPEPGEGELFYRKGSRRMAMQAVPNFVTVPAMTETDPYPALRWYGRHAGERVPDMQFDFPLLSDSFEYPAAPHDIVFIGPLGEWDDPAEAEAIGRHIGGTGHWVVAWRYTDGGGSIRFQRLTLTTDMTVAPGVIEPERYRKERS